jgi:hypothetical protein
MNQNLMKRLFVVTSFLHLNETSRPMKPGEQGFAFVPLGAPVHIEVDTTEYTADRSTFEAAIEWVENV